MAAAEIARDTVFATNRFEHEIGKPRKFATKQAHWNDNNICTIKYLITGWGGRIRTSAWRNQNPLPYRLATPQCRFLSQAAAGGGRTIKRGGTGRNRCWRDNIAAIRAWAPVLRLSNIRCSSVQYPRGAATWLRFFC